MIHLLHMLQSQQHIVCELVNSKKKDVFACDISIVCICECNKCNMCNYNILV